MSRTVGPRTIAPWLGRSSTVPVACSLRSASRTGVRLTEYSAARRSCRRRAPTGISPLMIRAWMLAASSSTTPPRPLLYPVELNLYPKYSVAQAVKREKGQVMRRISAGSVAALVAFGLALAVAGCGSGGNGGGGNSGGGAPNSGTIDNGGTLTVALAEDPDQL